MHIAVEFVHPVIVGKRALPAVALTGPDLVDLVRVSVRPGDIVVAVAGADDAQVRSVMRRAPAWGATTIWIGSGQRPKAGIGATMCCGSTTPTPGFPRRVASCCSTTCCGSSPTCVSSTPGC